MNNAALGLRGPMLYVLQQAGIHYIIANIISLAALMMLRYLTADRLIWSRRPTPPESPTPVAAQAPFATASVGRD